MNGRVEVCVDGTWGSVCDDEAFVSGGGMQGVCSFFNQDPSMAIPTPGNSFPLPPDSSSPTDDTRLPSYYRTSRRCLDNGTCTITASNIMCSAGGAAVFCPAALSSSPDDEMACLMGDVRLVGGVTPAEGRVEVCLDNRWGTVCDDSWDTNSAAVVCTQLGMPTDCTFENLLRPLCSCLVHCAVAVSLSGPETVEAFGSGSGDIWLDDVKCGGNETHLLSCPQFPFTQPHNCKHSEDSGVRCKGQSRGT